MNYKNVKKIIACLCVLSVLFAMKGSDTRARGFCDFYTPVNAGVTGASFSGSSYYNQLDATSQTVYNNIYAAFSGGPANKEIKLDISYRKTVTLVRTKQGLTLSEASGNELEAELTSFLKNAVTPAYLALLYDHPEMSWITNASYGYYYSIKNEDYINIDTNAMTAEVVAKDFTFKFTDVNMDTGDADSIAAALDRAASDMSADMGSAGTTYDRLKVIHDYLCNSISYNTTAANGGYGEAALRIYNTAYSAFYGINGSAKISTLCAGYAKAFKLLCDYYDITCVLVSGTSCDNGNYTPHMWNYVKADGGWYAVDCTWDDQDGRLLHDFFMVGSDTIPEHFTNQSFSESHRPDGNWGAAGYNFNYPTLSSGAYRPGDTTDSSGGGDQPAEPDDTATTEAEALVTATEDTSESITENTSGHDNDSVTIDSITQHSVIESQIPDYPADNNHTEKTEKNRGSFAVLVFLITGLAAGLIIYASNKSKK